MKLQTYQAFKNHLQQHLKSGSDPLFCILGNDFYEREIIIKEVLAFFKEARTCFLDLQEVSISDLHTEIDSQDLFSEKKVIVLKSVEKASKSLIKELSLLLQKRTEIPLILEGEKLDATLYDKLKNKIIVLDLTKEKPWDRKSRIISWLHFFVRRDKKELSQELAEHLYEVCSKQLSLMIQELTKLICFCKDVHKITLSDYKSVSSNQKEEKLWALSEAVVFDPKSALAKEAASKDLDPGMFHQLISQVRYHLQIAAKIQALKEEGANAFAKASFPTLQPKTLQKYENALSSFSVQYAKKGLHALFEVEVKAKSISIDENVLWIHLLSQLDLFRKKEVS